ncbi:Transcription initiation factor TFIID subunit 12 [Tulasnella sp. 331]|nr:Transcription initiation factor TFIID subunit 12 [Tulasnella sp. 331]
MSAPKPNGTQQQQQQQAQAQAQSMQMLQQQQQQAIQAQQAQGVSHLAAGSTQAQALLANMPQLVQLARAGQLSDTQVAQLSNIMRLYGPQVQGLAPQMQAATAAAAAAAGAGASRPATAMTAQAPQLQTTTSQQQQQPQQQQQSQPQSQSQPQAQQSQPQPQQQQPQQQQQPTQPPDTSAAQKALANNATSRASPPGHTSAASIPHPIPTELTSASPGPQDWPNTRGPRPSLSQGLATSSSIMGLPTHVAKPADTLDALGALNEGFKKDATLTANDLQMRRTIKDLVASIDPNVKIDPDVEDILLQMADEFIDSVTNFSCRLAKHRGSDTLDVKDLQLHLERNHNIRIPGFSSDETRLAISHSNPATGGQGFKAAKVEPKPVKGEGADKDKDGKDSKEAASAGAKESKKSKAAKMREAQATGAATRAARLAAVRALK